MYSNNLWRLLETSLFTEIIETLGINCFCNLLHYYGLFCRDTGQVISRSFYCHFNIKLVQSTVKGKGATMVLHKTQELHKTQNQAH